MWVAVYPKPTELLLEKSSLWFATENAVCLESYERCGSPGGEGGERYTPRFRPRRLPARSQEFSDQRGWNPSEVRKKCGRVPKRMQWIFWSAELGKRLEAESYKDGAVCLQHIHPRRWQNPWNGTGRVQIYEMGAQRWWSWRGRVLLLHRKDQVQLRGMLWHEYHSWAQGSSKSSCYKR